MFGLVILEFGCNYFIGYYGHLMGAKMEADMRRDIFGHYQKLTFAFYDNQKVGGLLSRITSDLFDITELLHHGPEDIVISIIKLVGSFAILFSINAKLTLVAFAFIPVMILYAGYYNRKMKRAFKRNREKIADINSQIEDSLSGIRVVKSFANEKIEMKKFQDGNDRFVAAMKRAFKRNREKIADINSQIEDSLSGIRVVKSFANEKIEMKKFQDGNDRFVAAKKISYRYMGAYNSGLGALTTLVTVVVLIAGVRFMAAGTVAVTDLITFLLYINNFTEPVKKLVKFTEQFQNGYSGFERFLEILSIAPDIKDKEDAVSVDHLEGKIEFENVSFHYEDSTENVLDHINLDVEAGDYMALVGPSGVGKTTICSLIPRFYEVSEGAIRIDGIDIRDMKLDDLRNNIGIVQQDIGIVQQDVYLFAGTIMENIRYGKPDATDEEVVMAARNANAHEFIMSFPEGYDTDIGQRGVKLSGGQKQRLSMRQMRKWLWQREMQMPMNLS